MTDTLEAKPLGQIDVTDAGVAGAVRKDFLIVRLRAAGAVSSSDIVASAIVVPTSPLA